MLRCENPYSSGGGLKVVSYIMTNFFFLQQVKKKTWDKFPFFSEPIFLIVYFYIILG